MNVCFEVCHDGVIRMPVSWDAMLHCWISGCRRHLQGFKVREEMNVFEKLECMCDLDQQSNSKISWVGNLPHWLDYIITV
jgi:hypothetical protein